MPTGLTTPTGWSSRWAPSPDSLRDVVDYQRERGVRAGAVAVTSFRPFPAAQLAATLATAKAAAVVERTDEPAASGQSAHPRAESRTRRCGR